MAIWRLSWHQIIYISSLNHFYAFRAWLVLTEKVIAQSQVDEWKILIWSCWLERRLSNAIHLPSLVNEQQRRRSWTPGSSFLFMKFNLNQYTIFEWIDQTQVTIPLSPRERICLLSDVQHAERIVYVSSLKAIFQDRSIIENTCELLSISLSILQLNCYDE